MADKIAGSVFGAKFAAVSKPLCTDHFEPVGEGYAKFRNSNISTMEVIPLQQGAFGFEHHTSEVINNPHHDAASDHRCAFSKLLLLQYPRGRIYCSETC